MTMTLPDMVGLVAVLREADAENRSRIAASRTRWERENAALLTQAEGSAIALQAAETALRAAAIAKHRETGTKTPTPGVGIRVLTKLRYDPATALRWAEDHKIALSLDKSAFERQARITPLSFVDVVETPQAAIATDLSDVIAAQQEEMP